MAYLDSLSGNSIGKRYELDQLEMVMGRHPDCAIVLDSGAVSRQHAKMIRSGTSFLIEDMKSRNGTFVNGRLIEQPAPLEDGDVIRVCDLELSFHADLPVSEFDDGSSHNIANASKLGVLIVDDADEPTSHSVMAKMEVRGSTYGAQVSASPEVKLAAMLEIMNALGKAVSIEDVLPKVLDSLFRIFVQADRGFIVLKDDSGTLQPRWVKTRRPEQEEQFRISRTIMKQVMQDKEAIISLDAGSDERFEMSQSVADFRIRSMIVAPLLDSEGEPLGAIQIDTVQHKGRFEAKDLEVLSAVANQAGIAIENAQLHEQMVLQRLVEQDLELAKQVQQAFLPRETPDLPEYDFYQYYNPASEIGGDYFDYIPLENDRMAIVVADVVGHGVAAAMFMAKLSAETRFAFASEDEPAKALTLLNERVTALGVERFVTMCVIILHPQSGNISIVNAGHMPPVYRDQQGTISEPGFDNSGPPLGIMTGIDYEEFQMQIHPGELLAMYTDGVFEAPNKLGEQFSIARVKTMVGGTSNSLSENGNALIASVTKHIIGCAQEDDMCLVMLNRLTVSS